MVSNKFWKIVTFSSLTLSLILLIFIWQKSEKKHIAPVKSSDATAVKPAENSAKAASPAVAAAPALSPAKPVVSAAVPNAKIIAPAKPASDIQAVTVHSGDSLGRLFSRMKLGYSDLKPILKLPKMKLYSNRLKVNQVVLFKKNSRGQLLAMKLPLDLAHDLLIKKQGRRFVETVVKKPMKTEVTFRQGSVRGSFAKSAAHAGLNSALTEQFKHIFHNDINHVHARDHFEVLYNEYYVNGHKYHNGDIIAAEITINHHPHYAFLFDAKNHHAYFDQNGNALKSRFVMPPVNYSHISGTFSYRRLDPVLHVVRPHLGIDFAAPRGTPVKSIGAGRVAFSGRENGYGNTVIVQYGNTYKALYGHLQSPARGIHTGTPVQQGQVLGYVGSTGWATGPHVHFELYVHGKPQNPLTMHAVAAQSVPKSYLARFKNRARQLIHSFRTHEQHNA